MFRPLRGAGSPYFVAPGTAGEHTRILQAAFQKAYDDPDFQKEYKKLTGDDPSAIGPADYRKGIEEIPRDPVTIELYKKFSGGDSLPQR
jgi:hypothetical protein